MICGGGYDKKKDKKSFKIYLIFYLSVCFLDKSTIFRLLQLKFNKITNYYCTNLWSQLY